jgi:hypothetical protein
VERSLLPKWGEKFSLYDDDCDVKQTFTVKARCDTNHGIWFDINKLMAIPNKHQMKNHLRHSESDIHLVHICLEHGTEEVRTLQNGVKEWSRASIEEIGQALADGLIYNVVHEKPLPKPPPISAEERAKLEVFIRQERAKMRRAQAWDKKEAAEGRNLWANNPYGKDYDWEG